MVLNPVSILVSPGSLIKMVPPGSTLSLIKWSVWALEIIFVLFLKDLIFLEQF